MSDKMRETILPCPFCGGEDIHVLTTGFKKESQGYLMSCGTDKCPASNMSVDGEFCAAVVDWDSEEEAISAWNKRAWQAAQAERVLAPSCRECANRGRVNGLSQEIYCDSCVWQGQSFRVNHYAPLPKKEAK